MFSLFLFIHTRNLAFHCSASQLRTTTTKPMKEVNGQDYSEVIGPGWVRVQTCTWKWKPEVPILNAAVKLGSFVNEEAPVSISKDDKRLIMFLSVFSHIEY